MIELAFNLTGKSIRLADVATQLIHDHATSMIDPAELAFIAGSLLEIPWQQGEIIVEIGAWRGDTTVFMAKFLDAMGHKVPILSIDPFERVNPDPLNPQGSYLKYLENILKSGLEQVCFPLVAFSQEAAPVVPERIGFLLVDGDHHYPAIAEDLTLYTPKLVTGGLLFIDDYLESYAGVMRATDEFLDDNAEFQILHKTYFVIARKIAFQGGGP
jgi:hypothetical protein